jgi:hypothetical protein
MRYELKSKGTTGNRGHSNAALRDTKLTLDLLLEDIKVSELGRGVAREGDVIMIAYHLLIISRHETMS